jgi:DNA-binding NarL/FixJ family response regulator
MREKPIRVLLVDDQVLMRRGLRKLLEVEDGIEVVGEAADGVEALQLIPDARPDVALVDARMPRMDGVDLIRRLSEEHPRVAAIVLTTFDDDEYIFGGLRAGAMGYLLKDTPPEELVSAIEKASRGETVLGGQIAARVISELRQRTDPAEHTLRPEDEVLSEREVEVAKLVGVGATNREIAPVG